MRAHNLRNLYQIAVIGGNGFLGRSIIHRLSTYENLRIFSIDKRVHGIPINTQNYKAIVQQIVMDVSNENAINAWLMAHPVDAIIFVAGFENPTDGLGFTYREDTKALLALENTLVAMNDMNLESNEERPYFLYVSSWSVYGPQRKIAIESTKEYPGNYSGMLRLTGEDLVKRCCTKLGSKWCIVRPTEVYGRKNYKELANGNYWPGYVNYYIDKVIKRDASIEIFSPNTEVDVIHINYFTKVISKILQEGVTGIYNICSGKTIKIQDLVHKILEIDNEKGYLPEIKYKDTPKIENMKISSSRIEELLPYDSQKYNLSEFLESYLKVRRLEISKHLAIESIISEPVILDPTTLTAKEKYLERQIKRKSVYGKIKQIAGDQFFNLGVGNIVRRYSELEKLNLPDLNADVLTIENVSKSKLDLLTDDDGINLKKKRKKQKV